MKDIEDEIPFDVPDGWSWVRLNELADIARGGSPRPIENFITNDENGINWIKIGDTAPDSKYITSAKEKIIPEGKNRSRFVHAGDFLLTNSMSFGRPYILKIDGCIHDGWLVFADIKKCLYKDFLYYAFSSLYIYNAFSLVAAGSTVKNLKSDTVKQVLFPLPPLTEQQLIVAEIEKIFAQIDLLEQNKTDLQTAIKQAKSKILDLAIHGKLIPQDPNDEPAEEFLKRIATSDNRPYKKFEEAVLFEIPKSWSWCYLHTISALLNGDRGENYPSKKDYVECGIPFINAGCLDNGNINYDVANYITEEKYNSLRAGKIQKGDILYCLRGSLGKTGFVITDNKGAISSSLCIFRLNESVIPQYFLYVLNSNAIKVQQKMVDNGTAQPNLSAKDVSNYQIPLPPLAEQYRIVTKIEELFEKLDIISN